MKTFLQISTRVRVFLAAICFVTICSAKAENGCQGPWPRLSRVAAENDPFARVWLSRTNTDLAETIGYFTADGTAAANTHYLPTSGSVVFAPGQTGTNVDIPLLDNGLVDGLKWIRLIVTREGTNSVDEQLVGIEDNELGTAVDPLFTPDVSLDGFFGAIPTPDGGLLLSSSAAGLTLLQSNGLVNTDFAKTFAATHKASFRNQLLYGLRVLSNGEIFANIWTLGTNVVRLARFLPSGSLDTYFATERESHHLLTQHDGKILVSEGYGSLKLRRFHRNGTLDDGFIPLELDHRSFALQPDGKILIVQSNSLVRINPDGDRDNSFSSPRFANGVADFLLRENQKVIVFNGYSTVQLNEDGSVDTNFMGCFPPQVEAADDRLLNIACDQVSDTSAFCSVIQCVGDGKPIPGLARFRTSRGNYCGPLFPRLVLGSSGHLFLLETAEVDGFRRAGLARLFTNPPERDFRVLTPAEAWRADGVARVRVVRTGPTTNAASVSFGMTDGTAKAGQDYVLQSGTLNFAPLEVSKELTVPLLARAGVDVRLWFNLELSNPSAGYSNIASTPIAILPDFRIATDLLRPRADGSIAILLRGTVPGKGYGLESSNDLKNWEWIRSTQASGSTLVFDNLPSPVSPKFYRARTD